MYTNWGTRRICFTIDSLMKLLTHFTEGRGENQVPLRAEVKKVGTSKYLNGWVGIIAESHEWTEAQAKVPLHIRYNGEKVLSWKRDGSEATFEEAPDAPKSKGI